MNNSWYDQVRAFYTGKRVLITGHTGFKGSWLSEWLLGLGASVAGYSKGVPSEPAAFHLLGLESRIHHVVGDVRDLASMEKAVVEFEPDCVFHLAAQALVRASYREPLETFSTNVMGSAVVLEACRKLTRPSVFVNVTSDKCYENRDWEFGYRETDAMGGADPYSASKGCAELVFSAYHRSFLAHSPVRAASGRAGNVIGGGDFAEDRLIPDCVRAWSRDETVTLRNPEAVRPWQHVLEPLGGYLLLGAFLAKAGGGHWSGQGFNFGPLFESCQPVVSVVEQLRQYFPRARVEVLGANERAAAPHEARTLKLSVDRAAEVLGWRPALSFAETVEWTAKWYGTWAVSPESLPDMTRSQIDAFAARVLG